MAMCHLMFGQLTDPSVGYWMGVMEMTVFSVSLPLFLSDGAPAFAKSLGVLAS